MSITAKGTIHRSDIGSGTWSLVTSSGETYELYKGAPKDLLQEGLHVKVAGIVRDDVVTMAMIGPVLEVTQFEAQEG